MSDDTSASRTGAATQAFPPAPAGWWRRAAATLIDAVLVLILAIATLTVANVFTILIGPPHLLPTGVAILIQMLVVSCYFGGLLSRQGKTNGQTLGKQLLGIRVVRDDGEPINFTYAVLREVVTKSGLFGIVAMFLAGIPSLINCLWPLWDPENRALHDMLVKTHVIRAAGQAEPKR